MKLLLHHQISASFAQTNAILLSALVFQSSKTNWFITFYETAFSIYYSGHMFDQNELLNHVNNCSKIQLQEQTLSKALKSALNTSSLCVTRSFRSFLEMLSRLKHTCGLRMHPVAITTESPASKQERDFETDIYSSTIM